MAGTAKKSYIVYSYKTCLEGNSTAHTIAPVIGEPKVNENGDTVFMTAMGGEITFKEGTFEVFESKKEAEQRYLDIIIKRFKAI